MPCTRLIINKWSNFDGRPHCRGRFLMMRVWDRPICDRRRATFHGGELSVTRTVINFKDCHCPPCWIFRSRRASTCHRIKFHRNRLNRCKERLWQLIVRHLGFIGRVMAASTQQLPTCWFLSLCKIWVKSAQYSFHIWESRCHNMTVSLFCVFALKMPTDWGFSAFYPEWEIILSPLI